MLLASKFQTKVVTRPSPTRPTIFRFAEHSRPLQTLKVGDLVRRQKAAQGVFLPMNPLSLSWCPFSLSNPMASNLNYYQPQPAPYLSSVPLSTRFSLSEDYVPTHTIMILAPLQRAPLLRRHYRHNPILWSEKYVRWSLSLSTDKPTREYHIPS